MDLYKSSKAYEVSIQLFEQCNLNCDFCFEDHSYNTIDYEDILQIPNRVFNGIKDDIIKYNINSICFRIWGGELFQDNFDDSIFAVYKKFYDSLIDLFKTNFPSVNIEVSWLTNGIFTKYDRVIDLIKYSNSYLGISYDSIGRFHTDEQLTLWKNCYSALFDYIKIVSITLTKPSMRKYIDGDSVLNGIIKHKKVEIDYYTANKNWKDYLPNGNDLFDFYYWNLKSNNFNFIPLMGIFDSIIGVSDKRYCSCKYESMYKAKEKKCIKDCTLKSSYLPKDLFYQDLASKVSDETVDDIRIQTGMKKVGCLTCEHFSYCQMFCWVSVIFKYFDVVKCPLYRIYELITPEMVTNYKDWKKKKCIILDYHMI